MKLHFQKQSRQIFSDRLFLPTDFLCIGAVALCVLVSAAWTVCRHAGTTAVVRYADTDNTESLPLDKDTEMTVVSRGYHLTVTVKDGKIAVTASDCPDHCCEKVGFIGSRGQSILCVPAGVIIETKGGDFDATVG